MENHPIPQNVTGFQFKLIGDMTVKQFVYLAAGVVSGWLFFSLPITPFIRFPVSLVFILTGISLAFIPIAGRPIDVMIANFIKSLLSPTQYIYRKTAYQPYTPQAATVKGAPIDESVKENESLPGKEAALAKGLEEAKSKKILSLEKQLEETLAQNRQLVQQIIDLQKKLNLQKETVNTSQNLKHVPKSATKSVGLPQVSDAPNVIAGIVKDPRGNPLPGILVEVKDKEGNPVRAFKTSLLGQFASATSLSNGVYLIEFEDPREQNKFDSIELRATGQTIMPIEVRSIDPREELRQSLFGQEAN